MADNIDLNEEEEAALDAAWKKIDKATAEQKAESQPFGAALWEAKDASGHEHKGKGKGGGQFTKGSGGADSDEKSAKKTKKEKPSKEEPTSPAPAKAHEHIKAALDTFMQRSQFKDAGGVPMGDVYAKAKHLSGGALTPADFERDLQDLEAKGELHFASSGQPDYLMERSVTRDGKSLDIVRPGPEPKKATEPEAKAEDKPAAEKPTPTKPAEEKPSTPKTFNASLEDKVKHLSRFVEYHDGVVPMHKLFDQMKKDLPDLAPQDFHANLMQLWKDRKIELHVQNDSSKLSPEERKLGIEHNDKHYAWVRLKPLAAT